MEKAKYEYGFYIVKEKASGQITVVHYDKRYKRWWCIGSEIDEDGEMIDEYYEVLAGPVNLERLAGVWNRVLVNDMY